MNRALLPRHLKFRPLVASLALAAVACAQAQATLPSGLQVAAGQASAQTQGGVLTVTNSANAILNWQSFSIGAQNAVRFVQPSASSQVLNRVTGNDPSAILGSLSSNGRVWLLNPNGVLFGQGARVDVAGLVTSTLNIANEDWLAGRHVLGGDAPAAGIVNHGEIRTSLGGRVALVGGTVENQGLIEAPGGQVLLAAGRSVELVDTGAPNLAVRIRAPQGDALNLGTLSAAGGRIDVHGASVNQQGVVRADSLAVGPAGEIVLQAGDRLTLAAGSVTRADAAAGQGGQIQLLGREVAVMDGASASASGGDGGGRILAGGGAQGRDAGVPNAQALFFGRGASLAADAWGQGNGGQIVLWSDRSTRAFGTLSARGGASGGNGGLIETSGGWLDARPARLDVSAPNGRAGTWLLDPYNITITDGGSGIDTGYDASFTATANDAVISSAMLSAALTSGTNVTVSTGTGGSQAGNITVTNANITPSNVAPVTLTLQAAGDIVLDNVHITNSGGPLNVSLQSAGSGTGAVSINNAHLWTGGGNLSIGGQGGGAAVGHAGMPDGVKIIAVDITTSAGGNGPTGDVSINGRTAEAGGRGVFFAVDPSFSNNFISTVNSFSVTGNSSAGRGVEVNDLFLQQAKSTIAVTGIGTDGLYITNHQFPQVYFGGASVSFTGRSTGTGYGLYIATDPAASTLVYTSSGDFSAIGRNTAGGQNALYINSGGGAAMFSLNGNLSLAALGGGALLSGLHTTNSDILSQFELFSDSTLKIDSSALSAGFIHVRSPSTQLLGTTSLYGGGAGTAILIEGPSSNPATSFDNQAGSGALGLDPNAGGRWLLWSLDRVGSANVNLGGLGYDFQRYGATSVAAAAGDAGNGVASFNAHFATANGSVASRAYDGTTQATLSNLSFTLDVPGDTPGTLSPYTATFASKDVGTRAVTVNFSAPPSFTDAGGHPVYGYTVQSTASGNITPALLSGTVSAANKVYDATTGATVSVSGVTGFVGNETVGVTATGSFSDKNVGTGKTVAAGYQLSNGSNGGLASNYQFLPPASNLTASITPAPLSFSARAQDKVYDAQTAATLTSIAITPLGSDRITLNAGTANFSDKNVGNGKAVSISGASLSGPDAGNYVLAAPTGLTANITPATLTYTATALSRSYDGTTMAQLTGLSITPLGSDQVNLVAGTAAFSDKNAGTGKAVATSGFSLAGSDAPNYVLAAPTGLTATITPALLSGTVSAADKVYDATTGATVSVSGLTGLIGSETVGVTATGSFADKNVGTGKTVAASYQLSNGSNGGLASNYQFQPPAGAVTASITPATLGFTATALSRSYDGTTVAPLTGLSITPLGSDQVSLVAGTAAFSDKNAGTGKAVATSGFSLAGSDAPNYVLAAPTGLTATITPALLSGTVSAASKVYDATNGATVSVGGLTGLVGSETVGVTATGSFADKNVGTGKTVAASYQLSDGGNGGLASNYQFQPPAGAVTASITPATLTYLADAAVVLSGAPLPTFTGTVSGFRGGDTPASATTGTAVYQASVATSVVPGVYAINGGGLSATNYVFVQDSRNAQALQIPSVSPAQETAQASAASLASAQQTSLPDTPTSTPQDTGLLDLTAPSAGPAPALLGAGPTATQASTGPTAAQAGAGPTAAQASAGPTATPPSVGQAAAAFGPQPLGEMSTAGLASLLDLRQAYKSSLFAESISRLKKDPTLADLPICKTLQEAAEGKCLLTEELKRKAQALRIAAAAAPASLATAPVPTLQSAQTPPAMPVAAAPAVPATVPAAQPDAASTPEFLPFGKRHIRQAALPQITRKMALLIGAGVYQDQRMPSLANAVGDVRAVGELLETQLGYETVVIANANRASVIAALNQLAIEAGPHDSVVVYYAGHGELVDATAPGERHGYWQLVDSRPDRPESWLSNSDIARLLNQIGASQVALISDSCYSGALASGERLRAVPGNPNPAALLARRSAVVMSSGGNEPVFDSGKDGHSPFAWNLMSTLKKVSGWQPGGNVFERVRFGVARELPQRPQYAAAAGHQEGGDYLFERRELDGAKR